MDRSMGDITYDEKKEGPLLSIIILYHLPCMRDHVLCGHITSSAFFVHLLMCPEPSGMHNVIPIAFDVNMLRERYH